MKPFVKPPSKTKPVKGEADEKRVVKDKTGEEKVMAF